LAARSGARIIVPTSTLARHLRNQLAREGLVFPASSISTFHALVAELAPDAALASDLMATLAVEQAVLGLNPREFAKIKHLPGLYTRLSSTFAELELAGLSPSDLEALPKAAALYGRALAAIWGDTARQLQNRGLETRAGLLRRLAAKADLRGPARIWFHGLATLSAPEIELITALGRQSCLAFTIAGASDTRLRDDLLARGFIEEIVTGTRPDAAVRVVRADTAEREVDEIARRVIEMAGERVALREIGVVVRNPAKYVPLLRAAFERFGAVATDYFGQALADSGVGRFAVGIVECMLAGWEHESTITLLRFLPSLATSAACDSLEVKVRTELPGQGLALLRQWAGKSRELQRTLHALQEFEHDCRLSRAPSEWAAVLGRLTSWFRPAADQVLENRALVPALDALREALDLAAQWWPSPDPIAFAEFWRVARTAIRRATIIDGPAVREAVQIISVYEARQWQFSRVFVCGLVENEFPQQHARNPFLSDSAVRLLRARGAQIRTSVERDEEEEHLFTAAFTSASDVVILSYPRKDGRGQPLLRSRLLDAYAGDEDARSVRPALPLAIGQWTRPGMLRSGDLLHETASRTAKLSVTSLERVLECRYQFFAQKVLKLREIPERPEDRLTPLVLGSIAHTALERWFSGQEPIEPLLRRLFAAIGEEHRVQPGYRTEREHQRLLRALERFIKDESYPGASGSRLEASFEFELEPGLVMTGKLDRLDLLSDGRVVIVDYKYSSSAATKGRVEDETRLQGPLYAYATREALGYEPAAMVYISLKDKERPTYHGWGEIEGFRKPLEPITTEWMDAAIERARDAIRGIRSGAIQPNPSSDRPCQWCTFRDACRYETEAAISARTANE
jgi:ATP-dependent helicase/DNAse subunit B